jgi:hypothetical protein
MSKVSFHLLLVLGFSVFTGWAQSNTLLSARLVNVPTQPCLTAGGPSYAPQFSPDGRHLYFVSSAANLTTNQKNNGSLGIYRHDLNTRTTILISASTNDACGDGMSFGPSISSNNQFVAFLSRSRNLVSNLFNEPDVLPSAQPTQVYLRDTLKQANTLISAYSTSWSSSALGAQISGDGQSVVFQATGMGSCDIQWWNTQHPTQTLVHPIYSVGFPKYTELPRVLGFSSDGFKVLLLGNQGIMEYGANSPGRLYLVNMEPVLNGQPQSVAWVTSNSAASIPGFLWCTNAAMPPTANVVAYLAVVGSNSPTAALVLHHPASGLEEILATNCLARSPLTISDDGRRLLVEEVEGFCLYEVADGKRILLATPDGSSLIHPTLSGNGRCVAFFTADPFFAAGAGNHGFHLAAYDVLTQRYRTIATNTLSDPDQVPAPLAISPEGEKFAFETANSHLVPNDLNQAPDVFWTRGGTGEVHCLSVAGTDEVGLTAAGLILPGKQASRDGRMVAFVASDGNLVPGDTNHVNDVFLCDMVSGTNWLISQDEERPGCHLAGIGNLLLSSDGGTIGYIRHYVTNNQLSDLLVCRDTRFNRVLTNFWAAHQFQSASLGAAGQSLAFSATDAFVPECEGNTNAQVYLWQRSSAELKLISTLPGSGVPAQQPCLWPAVEPGEKHVVFITRDRSILPNVGTYPYEFALGIYQVASNFLNGVNLAFVAPAFSGITFSPQGRFAIVQNWGGAHIVDMSAVTDYEFMQGATCAVDENFDWVAYDLNGQMQLRDRVHKFNYVCGSVQQQSPPASAPVRVAMTSDARFVAYASYFTDSGEFSNGTFKTWLYDRLLRNSIPVKEALARTLPWAGFVVDPVFSKDDRTLTVTWLPAGHRGPPMSHGVNLVQVQLMNSDTDEDGLDDAWEIAFFDSLAQDGSGDYDQDGMSNAHELGAGTNPADGASILAATIMLDIQTKQCTLAWRSTPGKSYRIEYKDSAGAPAWNVLYPSLFATSTGSFFTDSNPATDRFYRLIVLP